MAITYVCRCGLHTANAQAAIEHDCGDVELTVRAAAREEHEAFQALHYVSTARAARLGAPKPVRQVCETCRYFQEQHCRRYPPVGRDGAGWGEQPHVRHDTTCGEWAAKPV